MHIAWITFISSQDMFSEVKCYVVKTKIQARIFEMHGPAELEGGTKALQLDVCCKATDQNFDCGCDRYTILRLDSLIPCKYRVPPLYTVWRFRRVFTHR